MKKVFKILLISGPKLPFKLGGSEMVTSPSGKGVIVIGGFNQNECKHSNALLELKGISSKDWVPLKQTLQHARNSHVVIQIPDDWTIPNTPKQQNSKKRKAQNRGTQKSGRKRLINRFVEL